MEFIHLLLNSLAGTLSLLVFILVLSFLIGSLVYMVLNRKDIKQAYVIVGVLQHELQELVDYTKRLQSASESLLKLHEEKSHTQEQLIAVHQDEIERLSKLLKTLGYDDQGNKLEVDNT